MPHHLVADWIAYHAERAKPSDPRFSSCEQLNDLLRSDPEAGWSATLDLIAVAADDLTLACVAAGPLEDLLTREGERFIDRVELQARRDPKFRRCLTGVWGLPASIRDRVVKFTSTVADPL